MSRIRATNTGLERSFLRLLSKEIYPRGYRYRKHYKKLSGKPDIVFVKQKIAVFLDGDFWHGHNFKVQKNRLPKKYWLKKIERNIERDLEINKKLRKEGWRVLRFWEHEIKQRPEKVVMKIRRALALQESKEH